MPPPPHAQMSMNLIESLDQAAKPRLTGRLLRPIPHSAVYAVIPCRGDGEGMEQTVRALVWLRSLGLLNCPVILMDAGLSPMGRETALRLALRWPDVVLWPAEDLKTYISYQ